MQQLFHMQFTSNRENTELEKNLCESEGYNANIAKIFRIFAGHKGNNLYHILGSYMKIMFAFLFMTYIFCVYVRQESGMNTKLILRLGVDILANFL